MNQRDEDRWASMKLYGAGEQAWERMDAFADGAALGRADQKKQCAAELREVVLQPEYREAYVLNRLLEKWERGE